MKNSAAKPPRASSPWCTSRRAAQSVARTAKKTSGVFLAHVFDPFEKELPRSFFANALSPRTGRTVRAWSLVASLVTLLLTTAPALKGRPAPIDLPTLNGRPAAGIAADGMGLVGFILARTPRIRSSRHRPTRPRLASAHRPPPRRPDEAGPPEPFPRGPKDRMADRDSHRSGETRHTASWQRILRLEIDLSPAARE